MIKAENICKGYINGKTYVPVLKEVSFCVKKGEMVAVVGTSGSGKSTLLRILGGIDKIESGSCTIDHIEINSINDKALASFRNEHIGFVFQNFELVEEESVYDNLSIPLLFSKTNFWKIDQRILDMLSLFHMESYGNKRVKYLSGGEKQRVAIMRALINQPAILLADEPTGALDEDNTNMILDIFSEIHKKGKTIVIVTHDINVAKRCDRILEIKNGRVFEQEREKK